MIDVVFALIAVLVLPDASIKTVKEAYTTRHECRQVRSELIEILKKNPAPAGVKTYLSECEAVPVLPLE